MAVNRKGKLARAQARIVSAQMRAGAGPGAGARSVPAPVRAQSPGAIALGDLDPFSLDSLSRNDLVPIQVPVAPKATRPQGAVGAKTAPTSGGKSARPFHLGPLSVTRTGDPASLLQQAREHFMRRVNIREYRPLDFAGCWPFQARA